MPIDLQLCNLRVDLLACRLHTGDSILVELSGLDINSYPDDISEGMALFFSSSVAVDALWHGPIFFPRDWPSLLCGTVLMYMKV